MKLKTIAIIALTISSVTAFADKEAREELKSRTQPAIDKAENVFKSSCGCPLPITIDASIVTRSDYDEIANIADSISDGAPHYCNDAASKKAMCQLKQLTLAKTKEAAFVYKGGKGTATTDGNAVCSWDMITKEIDK